MLYEKSFMLIPYIYHMSDKTQLKQILKNLVNLGSSANLDDAADEIIALFEEPQASTQDTKPDNPPPKPPGS